MRIVQVMSTDKFWRRISRAFRSVQKMRFTGKLLKRIDLKDAKAQGLRAAFDVSPDASHGVAFLKSEFQEKWKELDKFLGLDSERCDIWQQRTLALISLQYGIRPDDPHWWQRIATRLASSQVPGFSINMGQVKKHGAPVQWTFEQLAELFADVEFLKKALAQVFGRYAPSLQKEGASAGRAIICLSQAASSDNVREIEYQLLGAIKVKRADRLKILAWDGTGHGPT